VLHHSTRFHIRVSRFEQDAKLKPLGIDTYR